ncbi:hypothetical protein OC861_006835 [Tilletia horrida]|nr:hypothetical protein OC861_006835 [Tilletia horrida]
MKFIAAAALVIAGAIGAAASSTNLQARAGNIGLLVTYVGTTCSGAIDHQATTGAYSTCTACITDAGAADSFEATGCRGGMDVIQYTGYGCQGDRVGYTNVRTNTCNVLNPLERPHTFSIKGCCTT